MQPLVTIFISSYNHERYIEQTIQSVLHQSYRPIELIVIDDGSSDRCPAIIERLSKEHGFQFRSQANRGLAVTLNLGLSLAQGKYFCPLGSDDLMLPPKTELQVAYMEAHPEVAVCGSNVLAVDEYGHPIARHQRNLPARVMDFDDIFSNRQPAIAASTAMLRTDVLKSVGGYDVNIRLEDFALWLKLTHSGHRIGALEEVLLHYRKHPSNNYRNLRMMHQSLMQTYASYRHHPAHDKVINQSRISTFLTAAKRGQTDLATEVLREIGLRYYNAKVIRGLLHLARSRLLGKGTVAQ
jgi:alpha-1,3-rhamnosyltransferase